jgi:hypothetical protein
MVPLSKKGWHQKWFYLPNVGLALPLFSVDCVDGNALELWASLPSSAKANESKSLRDAIGWLKGHGYRAYGHRDVHGVSRPTVERSSPHHLGLYRCRGPDDWVKQIHLQQLAWIGANFGKRLDPGPDPLAKRDLGPRVVPLWRWAPIPRALLGS